MDEFPGDPVLVRFVGSAIKRFTCASSMISFGVTGVGYINVTWRFTLIHPSGRRSVVQPPPGRGCGQLTRVLERTIVSIRASDDRRAIRVGLEGDYALHLESRSGCESCSIQVDDQKYIV